MKITDVRVKKLEGGNGKLRGIASVGFDDVFVIHNISIIDGNNGLVVSMPSKKGKDNKYNDICHPITKEFREELNKAILDKYNEAV